MRGPVVTARSMLFVPGDRPDRFGKAAAAGADAVVLDLEDAVDPGSKEYARSAVADWLSSGPATPVVVRINAAETAWFAEDRALLREYGCPVMLPKAQDPDTVRGFDVPVLALLETALGIEQAGVLARAGPVVRLAFGSIDLAAELGVRPDNRVAMSYARSRLVIASAAAGIAAPLDGVTAALDDPGALATDVEHANAMGFGGKLCVHPKQLAAVNAGFSPSEAELDWARRVLAAEGDGAATVDGEMVDKPVLDRARALLARSRP